MRTSVTSMLAAAALLASLVVVTGCGGSSPSATTTATTTEAVTDTDSGSAFTPPMVENMIRKSIEPTLATNLGEGAKLKVTCKSTGNAALSCVTVIVPADPELDTIRVVYGVTCDARTCEWQPTG